MIYSYEYIYYFLHGILLTEAMYHVDTIPPLCVPGPADPYRPSLLAVYLSTNSTGGPEMNDGIRGTQAIIILIHLHARGTHSITLLIHLHFMTSL